MPRYKVLKGVAHNIGHSFTSLMNYSGDDYVMGHILRFARQTGHDTLTIDFVTREVRPPELVGPPISEIPAHYVKCFWESIGRQGSDPAYVRAARLTLQYDIRSERLLKSDPQFMKSKYLCDVVIIDNRGKQYASHFAGY